MKTDYADPLEVRKSAEAFDWIEQWMPEVKDLILAKFCPRKGPVSSIASAILVAELMRNRE